MGEEEGAKIELGQCPLPMFFMVLTATSILANFSHIVSGILGVYKAVPRKMCGEGVAVESAIVALGFLSQTSEITSA